jgi:hypothetical protein
MNKLLLGYDLRIHESAALRDQWNIERRQRFLLCPEVPLPMSVDTGVWPSLFDVSENGDATTHYKAFRLWINLSAMRIHIDRNISPDRATEIAIAVLDCGKFGADDIWKAVFAEKLDSSIEDSWTLLGYDIADRDLISGLSNCAYNPDEIELLRHDWGKSLNASGLFDQWQDADAFAKLSNTRVQEHAPFHIFALYAITTSSRNQ